MHDIKSIRKNPDFYIKKFAQRNVNFDIAITAEDQAQGGAKIKVLSGLLGGDVGGEKSSKNSIASRIQFNVPILLPSINVEDDEARAKSIVVSKRKRT